MNKNIKETKEFFNNQASNWDEREKKTKEELKTFLKFLPFKEEDYVLDVACGTGIISNIIYEITKTNVDAIDVAENMIEVATLKNNNPLVNFMCKNFYDMKGNYDGIIVFNAFPHFTDIDEFIETCNNLLNKDGYLVICHNLSRKQLDEHHKFLSENISRSLNDVTTEAKRFEKYFKPITLVDDDNSFIMVLKK